MNIQVVWKFIFKISAHNNKVLAGRNEKEWRIQISIQRLWGLSFFFYSDNFPQLWNLWDLTETSTFYATYSYDWDKRKQFNYFIIKNIILWLRVSLIICVVVFLSEIYFSSSNTVLMFWCLPIKTKYLFFDLCPRPR